MNIGHLNLPKLELDQFSFAHDIQTRLYLQYSKLIEGNVGPQLLKALESDQRVKALEGKMLSRGSSASGFNIKTLAMWFLWAINEFGQDEAEKYLNTFLDSETVPVINTLWVLGITTEKTLSLENGFQIVPISDMPDSREKEQYLKQGFQFPHNTPKPQAAIVHIDHVPKTQDVTISPLDLEGYKGYWKSSRQLGEIALVLNALDNVSCIPYYSTSYSLPTLPIGLFGGSGGGSPIHDIFGHAITALSENALKDINFLISSFDKQSENNKARLGRILSRLSQAKRRSQIEDKILDLGIALEMALLEDNKNNDQLSLSFRLRGSWLLGKDKESRKEIFKKLRELYQYRSQVAHSGILCGNDPEKIQLIRDSFSEYSLLAEEVVRHLMLYGTPDWTTLILDAGE